MQHILLINPKTICNDMIAYFSKSDASMENVRISMLSIIALLVNKFGAALDSPSPKIPEALAKVLQEDQSEWSDEQSIRNLSIVCCVAMAVGYRGDSSALALLLKTITDGILTDTRFGSYCSLSFTLMLQDGWNLSAENFCIMRRLYKQKVFSIVVPFLLDQSREPIATDHPNIKSNILIALVGIFANVPGDMVLQEIDRIVPVCLAGMDSLHPTVRLVSIQTITWALSNQPGILDGHISALVKRLVRVLQTNPGDGDYATKEIRLEALTCLKTMPKEFRIEKILPYRDEVLKALKRYGIVNRRRAVRALAVDCQMDWWKLVASTD
jgi:DNA repair/transcription protein MET18/MMS19